jgi:hypothetical protein
MGEMRDIEDRFALHGVFTPFEERIVRSAATPSRAVAPDPSSALFKRGRGRRKRRVGALGLTSCVGAIG